MARSIAPGLEHNLQRRYGLAARCARVRAADVAVLALEEPGSAARGKIEAEIRAALAEDRAEAIVLGCAGMADLATSLSRQFGVPGRGGGGGGGQARRESLAMLGLTTSKTGAWAVPLAKPR